MYRKLHSQLKIDPQTTLAVSRFDTIKSSPNILNLNYWVKGEQNGEFRDSFCTYKMGL